MKYIILTSIFLVSLNCWSCSCVTTSFSVNHIIFSQYVFKGTVVQKEEYKDEYNFEFYRYTVDIGEIIKGNMRDTFILNSFKGGSACGLNLKVGTEYYLFASGEKFADSCGQNVEATKVKRKFKKVIKNYKKNKNKKIWKDINGKLSSIGNLINGIPEGIWIYYNLDGSIEKIGEYLSGRRNGAWKFYYKNNSIKLNSKSNSLNDAILLERRLSRTEFYKNGKYYGAQVTDANTWSYVRLAIAKSATYRRYVICNQESK